MGQLWKVDFWLSRQNNYSTLARFWLKAYSHYHLLARSQQYKLSKRCEICSKFTIKKPGRRQWRHSGVFVVNFKHISFTPFSSVSIDHFEQVNINWVLLSTSADSQHRLMKSPTFSLHPGIFPACIYLLKVNAGHIWPHQNSSEWKTNKILRRQSFVQNFKLLSKI